MSSGESLELPQLVVQEDSGARAPLAVAEPDFRSGQILKALNIFRVAGQDHEPLGAVHQVDELQGQFRQIPFNIRDIIRIGLGVEEVAAAEMGPTVLQGQKTAGTADVGRGQPQIGVVAAQQGRQHVQGIIVAADHHQGLP